MTLEKNSKEENWMNQLVNFFNMVTEGPDSEQQAQKKVVKLYPELELEFECGEVVDMGNSTLTLSQLDCESKDSVAYFCQEQSPTT